MKTIRFLAVFFLLALVTFPPAAFPLEKLRLAYSGSGSGEEIHLIAQQAGIFKKHGLEVEIIRIAGGSTIVQAVDARQLQLRPRSAVQGVNAQLARFPLQVLSAPASQVCSRF